VSKLFANFENVEFLKSISWLSSVCWCRKNSKKWDNGSIQNNLFYKII